ncbi:MAG: LysE family translocator [Alphaproteobacteria bacterium]|uniref:LysE family translocator n=1 Tax=Rhizobium sp. AAP116 TaxID=1523429 RepID=UPI0006B97248|nr:LysE family translocator [Rhizobium sp. AAP116]KPF51510.1 lysine transporter LysE [Rhizobium sp. AAP116]MBU0737538.1 LysE family translocator [Alphaproteobacteria bacterium]MBU0833885.1 LysE family translocator [Alphaproteobacteria bacterium]MBU1766127.1 LysE family translocator [Alphaproteobacteria bacterium]
MTLDFLLTTLIIVATPGTGALFTLAAALGGGRRNALIAAFGCTLGIVPHMLAAALGLAALVAAEPRLFEAIRYAGIAYLIWMAIGLWKSGLVQEQTAEPSRQAWRIIQKAVLINLLNPKLPLFFLAFLPQFVDQADPAPLATMTGLSLVFMAVTFVVFALYGLAAAAMRNGIVERPHRMRIINRLLSCGFLAMAGRLALAER